MVDAHMDAQVLLEVFRILAAQSSDSTLDALVVASHVCTVWRAAALAPELWTHIPLKAGHAWAAAALSRSQPLPVVLKVPLSRHAARPSEHTVLEVFKALPRARVLSLLVDGWPSPLLLGDNILQPLREYDAPLLEELSLIFRNACPDAARVLSAFPLPNLRFLHVHNAWFSAPLFAPHTFDGGRLAHIRLTGESPRASEHRRLPPTSTAAAAPPVTPAAAAPAAAPWPPPVPFPLPHIALGALTRLEAPRAQWPSLPALLDALARMPALELLQLASFVDPRGAQGDAWAAADDGGAWPAEDEPMDGDARNGRRIRERALPLPSLRRLSLEGACDSVAEVFRALALGVHTKLQFICHLPSPRTTAFLTSMRAAVIAHYASAPACFRQTSIGENLRCFYFSATDYEDLYKLYLELVDVAPQASESLLAEHLGLLRALLPAEPFGGLQTLYFNDVRVLESTPPWKEWRPSLRAVTLVHIQARATYGLVEALRESDMFPDLRTLSIKGDVDDSVLDPLQGSPRSPRVEIRRR